MVPDAKSLAYLFSRVCSSSKKKVDALLKRLSSRQHADSVYVFSFSSNGTFEVCIGLHRFQNSRASCGLAGCVKIF